jgi:4'-phosphopantetheinyl transferase EntD
MNDSVYNYFNFGRGKIILNFGNMPIFFQQDIGDDTRLAVWKIAEDESFFAARVPLQREITHPHKRLQHLAGRYLLQHLYADFPLALIRIADTRKPFLENEAYHFSISHCGDYAAVIVSTRKRVGLDVEMATPKIERIKHKFLHPEELSMVDSRWSTADAHSFYNGQQSAMLPLTLLWSCKEAVFKWWSYGHVDFSEQIRLYPFVLQPSGSVPAAFIEATTTELLLHYRLFDELCLAWVST